MQLIFNMKANSRGTIQRRLKAGVGALLQFLAKMLGRNGPYTVIIVIAIKGYTILVAKKKYSAILICFFGNLSLACSKNDTARQPVNSMLANPP